MAPMRQPRIKMGRLRCMRRPQGVMWILRGSLSNTVQTRQPRTKTGGLRCIWHPQVVIWISHGSSSSVAPIQQPRTIMRYALTPLDLASVNGHVKLSQFLADHGTVGTAHAAP